MLLNKLSFADRAIIEAAGTIRVFKRNESIVKEDESCSSLYIILEGTVEVRKDLNDDNYKHLLNLGKGDVIGEIAFLGVPTRSASVVTLEDCRVLELTMEQFNNLEKTRPDIALIMYKGLAFDLASRLKHSNDELKKSLLVALYGLET